ncbi:hypothetical protein [Leisingera sp. M658]|uniref:hypothetical protein n=1 Tax=Leisingera sp. M658 TaxID=2867015 RepID=UPI0021A2A24B|nr:hypothetical protein [Leisingera sp. M658]UWQ74043.1 hypothetical protein K3724_16095 [Leisingera sp. M658]
MSLQLELFRQTRGSDFLSIVGTVEERGADYVLTDITLSARAQGGGKVETDLSILETADTRVELPGKLLRQENGGLRFVTRAEIDAMARHELEQLEKLRRRLRQRLADPIVLKRGETVLGLTGLAQVSLKLSPLLADIPDAKFHDDTVLLALQARVKVEGKLDFDQTIRGNRVEAKVDVDGQVGLDLSITYGDVQDAGAKLREAFKALVSVDIPALPGFDFDLPRVSLPGLRFDGIDIPFPDIPTNWPWLVPIKLPLGKLPIKAAWTQVPKLKVANVEGGPPKVTATDGAIKVTYGDENARALTLDLAFTGLELSAAGSKGKITYTLTSQDIPLPAPDPVEVMGLKVAIGKSALTLVVKDQGGKPHLLITHKITGAQGVGIVLADAGNPDTALHLDLEVTYTVPLEGGGQVTTQVTRFAIRAPYPFELIDQAIGQAGRLLRYLGQIKIPKPDQPDLPELEGLKQVLRRIADLVQAAARWLARQAGAAGNVIAGAAEGLAELIKALFERVSQVDPGGNAFPALAFDIRLDPKTYLPVQVIVMPAGTAPSVDYKVEALGVSLAVNAGMRPALVFDRTGADWFGLCLFPERDAKLTLGTDLWLDRDDGPDRSLGTIQDDKPPTDKPPHLIALKAKGLSANGAPRVVVLAALQRGKLKLFQTYSDGKPEKTKIGNNTVITLGRPGPLKTAGIVFGSGAAGAEDVLRVEHDIDVDELRKRALALMPKSEGTGDGAIGKLVQRVQITEVQPSFDGRVFKLSLGVKVTLDQGFDPSTKLNVLVSLDDLSTRLTGGTDIVIHADREQTYRPLGLDLKIAPKQGRPPWPAFRLNLARGAERFEMTEDTLATLTYKRVSTSGRGLVFQLNEFGASRGGFDLTAEVLPEPVKLGGIDVPFRFTSGQLSIKGSKFTSAGLAGKGQLPPALVGEANASIAMQLGRDDNGNVAVLGATAQLDKSGDPIRCHGTMFDLTITNLGFDFVNDGAYHFFFLLTGSAVFRPDSGAFAAGLMKNIRNIEIKLDKAPLGGNSATLLRSLSFLIPVDPPSRTKVFDIFSFDLRGIAFYPASDRFDGDPAMGISGVAKFSSFGDLPTPRFDFHEMLVAKSKGDSLLPRVKFDGLTVGLKMGAVDVEGTAFAVDDRLPSLVQPARDDLDLKANGFLASAKVAMPGWAPMSGAAGYLELDRRDGPSDKRHAFFMYGQLNKQSVQITTPLGTIFLREYGFGIGRRYTLAGIAKAETARSPGELIRILDEVSKYQGSLDKFEAWTPTYDNSDITLALRGMFSVAAANPGGPYDETREKNLPNPLLFDIVAAFRTDFTFLINLRAWLTTNYNDWVNPEDDETFKTNPTLRGYMYFSVPRKEFLARMLSDKGGHVGNRPQLPDPLVKAIKSVQFSSTLYIRPGLFHMEFGWPYELGFDLGGRDKAFSLKLRGGLINRIEDASLLYGMAFRADGHVKFGGSIDLGIVGASARAEAVFSLQAKILAYLSLKKPSDSIFYGMLRFDLTLSIRVEAWLRIPLVFKTITLRIGFSIHIAISIGLEAVVSPRGLGGQAHVTVGVRAFGRTLSLGLKMSFNNGLLARARAQVARFEALGLAADIPPASEDGQRAERVPRPDIPRGETVQIGDDRLDNDLGQMPIPQPAPQPGEPLPPYAEYKGDTIRATDFWALLFPLASGSNEYVLQLIPRDQSDLDDLRADRSSFYASPLIKQLGDINTFSASHTLEAADQTILNKLTVQSDPRLAHTPEIVQTDEGRAQLVLDLKMDTKIAGAEDGSSLYLGELLQTLFLNQKSGNGATLWEPRAPLQTREQIALPDDPQAAADELGRIGRSRAHLTGQVKLEAEIEEQRSALVSEIVEGADWLARNGVTGGAANPDAPVDPRSFGLTFVVKDEDLATLFDLEGADTMPPDGRFGVIKSDDITEEFGKVHLFNPPQRMFRNAQPQLKPRILGLDDHDWLREPDRGLRFDWDLEPAWGSSRSFYDDPEQHLKHYKITRHILGFPGGRYSASFIVKPATPTEFSLEKGAGDQLVTRVRQLRAPQQFVDDLREADPGADGRARKLPEALRDVLLGRQPLAGDEETPEQARLRQQITELRDLRVEYQFTPVDIAGTSETARDGSFGAVVTYYAPHAHRSRPVAPQEATLQVIYPALPSLVAADIAPDSRPDGGETGVPDLRLMLREAAPLDPNGRAAPAPDCAFHDATFDLRLWTDHALPSGGYGADAVSEARNRLGQEQIDDLAERGVAVDIRLLLEAAKAGDDLAEDAIPVVIERHGSGALETYHATLSKPDGSSVTAAQLAGDLGATCYQTSSDAITPVPGRVTRAYLRRRPPAHGAVKDDTTDLSAWRGVTMNLAILGQGHGEGQTQPLPVDTILESFEQPVALAFRALARGDMQARSGRMHIYRPAARGTLAGLASDKIEHNLSMAPDPLRRTATRLRWNVRPNSLALAGADGEPVATTTQELYRLVSGFRVFSLNPESFTGDANDPADLAAAAENLADLRLLPAEQRGLSPATFGDMARLEMAFPSQAWRDPGQRDPNLAQATVAEDGEYPGEPPWFSLAESLALFPLPRLRRMILADLEDGAVSDLFQGGSPDFVIAKLAHSDAAQTGTLAQRLSGWQLSTDEPETASTDLEIKLIAKDRFRVAELREALRNLLLLPARDQNTEALAAEQALLDSAEDRALLAGAQIVLTGWRYARDAQGTKIGKPQLVAQDIALPLDLVPGLHPILADTLARVTLSRLDQDRPGPVFHRYALVPDQPANPKAATFTEHLSEIPAKRDPHGFAALRTLGLATGFQLFDTDTGSFLRGSELLKRINTAFSQVIEVYRRGSALPLADEGLPFADLLTMPWGNGRLHWFDGGQEDIQEGDSLRLRDDETLAAVQISLRPAPDRLMPRQEPPKVTYWSMNISGDWLQENSLVQDPERGPLRLERFRVTWKQPDGGHPFLVDLHPMVQGIESLPQTRMHDGPDSQGGGNGGGELPSVQIGYTGPVGLSEGNPADHLLAFLRQARLKSLGSGDLQALKPFTVQAILVAPDGYERTVEAPDSAFTLDRSHLDPTRLGGIEVGMGVFKPLPDQDWGRILWQTAGKTPQPISALRRLMHYAQRRFDRPYPEAQQPIPVPGDNDDGSTARTGLAGAFTRFWLRFVEHTVVPASLDAPGLDVAPDIHFSLGTIADPGVWQQAPDRRGRVSIVIPDSNRRGGRRAYAVRPTGRYDDWAQAARWRMVHDGTDWTKAQVAPDQAVTQGLDGALGKNAALAQWIGVTLPRTAPLEKPVILSARRVPLNGGFDGRGRFEVVVAHPADMVLAEANRNNEALLAFEAISPELYRSFAHGAWMEWIVTQDAKGRDRLRGYDPLGAFGAALLASDDRTTHREPLTPAVARTRLRQVQAHAPDAWLGATAFSFAQLPYFFRTHINMHFSAGNMVSQRAHVALEEGFAKLHMASADDGYDQRAKSAPASWQVNAARDGLEFDLPLTRFVDAMSAQDGTLWFGADGSGFGAIKPVAHLPDPLISYRLGIETLADTAVTGPTRATQAQSFDIEIMPRPPQQPTAGQKVKTGQTLKGTPYVAKYSSGQLQLAGKASQTDLVPELVREDQFDWRIRVTAAIDTPAPTSLALAEGGGDALQDKAEELAETGVFDLTWQATLRFDRGLPEDETTKRAAMLKALRDMGYDALADRLEVELKAAADVGTLAQYQLQVTLPALFWTDVPEALQDYFQTETVDRSGALLRLIAPPTPSDMDLVKVELADPNGLTQTVQDWLFGPGRRPAFTATRGDLPPLSEIVAPAP